MCYMSCLEQLEKARQLVEDGPLVTEPMQRVHCVAMALKTSMDSNEDATACYELKMPESVLHSHFSSLLAGISLDKSSASHQKWLCNSYNNYQTWDIFV